MQAVALVGYCVEWRGAGCGAGSPRIALLALLLLSSTTHGGKTLPSS